MSHELTVRQDGRAEMAYTGDVPWHGLGNRLEPGQSVEAWVEAAGMDWRVFRARVRYATARGAAPDAYQAFDDRVVLFRSDTKAPLGIVSDGYQVVQPKDVLEFFRDLTEAGGMHLETAGTLFGGRKLWAMAAVTDRSLVVVDQRDRIKANLLLATSLDGSMATEGSWIATRVVCNNTLQMSQGETGGIRVKVNHKSRFDPQAAKADLGIEAAQSVFERTVADMRRLAATSIEPAAVVLATGLLFRPDFAGLERDEQAKVLRSKPVATVGRLALDGAAIGAEFEGATGTAYGWLNAVTEYVDHASRARTLDNRMDSAWFGRGAELKQRAYEMAMTGGKMSPASAVASVEAWLSQYSGGMVDPPEDPDLI